MTALLLREWRWTLRYVCHLAGAELGHKPPGGVAQGRDVGREQGEGGHRRHVLLHEVVILGRMTLEGDAPGGARVGAVGDARAGTAATLLFWQGGGRQCGSHAGVEGGRGGALEGRLGGGVGRGEVGLGHGWAGARARGRRGGLAVGLGQGAEAPPHRQGRHLFQAGQVLVQEVVVRVVVVCGVWWGRKDRAGQVSHRLEH